MKKHKGHQIAWYVITSDHRETVSDVWKQKKVCERINSPAGLNSENLNKFLHQLMLSPVVIYCREWIMLSCYYFQACWVCGIQSSIQYCYFIIMPGHLVAIILLLLLLLLIQIQRCNEIIHQPICASCWVSCVLPGKELIESNQDHLSQVSFMQLLYQNRGRLLWLYIYLKQRWNQKHGKPTCVRTTLTNNLSMKTTLMYCRY